MKKAFMAVLFAGCSFAAFAQSGGFSSSESAPVQGGFSGPGMDSQATSVAQAKMRRLFLKEILSGKSVMSCMNFVTIATRFMSILTIITGRDKKSRY